MIRVAAAGVYGAGRRGGTAERMVGTGTQFDTSWARRPWALVGRRIVLMGILYPLIWLYTRPRHHHRDRVERLDAPFILAANHSSHLDTPVIMALLPRKHRYATGVVAAADYFFDNVVTAAFVAVAFGTIPLERDGMTERTRKRIQAMLDEPWNLLLYPEGTRSTTGRMGRVKHGAAYFAIEFGVPIVPVYLTGTHEAMPKGANWATRHPVAVRFGEPLHPRPDEIAPQLTRRLRTALADLAAEAGRDRP